MRLIGSTLVVLAHLHVFGRAYAVSPTLYRMLGVIVPTFFIMSGYLRKRHFSKERIFKQVIKYGAIYLAVDYCIVLYMHVLEWVDSGQFSITGVAAQMLKGLVCCHSHALQLWFIPALLYPMILNAFLGDRARKIVIDIAAALFIATSTIGDDRLLHWFNELAGSYPAVGKLISGPLLVRRWRHLVTGLLYTTIGFDIDTWKVKPAWLFLAAVPFIVIESLTCYLGVAVILLSILFFYLVKRLPGQFLYPYHLEISLFSCLMYFLHIIEKDLFGLMTDSIPLLFFLIFGFNLAVTWAVSSFIRRKRQEAKP